jgi:hypothetical protein
LIASLQHKWLGPFRGLNQQVTRKFDLDCAEYAAKRPTGNRSRKIFDSEGERLRFPTWLRGQAHTAAGKKRDTWARIRGHRQTSVSISQCDCRSF